MDGKLLYNFVLSGRIFDCEDISNTFFKYLLEQLNHISSELSVFSVRESSNEFFSLKLRKIIQEEEAKPLVVLCKDTDYKVQVGYQSNRYHSFSLAEEYRYTSINNIGVIQTNLGFDFKVFTTSQSHYNCTLKIVESLREVFNGYITKEVV